MGGARTFLSLGPGGLAFEAGPDDVLPWVYTLDTGEDELHVVGGCTGLVEADTRVDLGDGLTLTMGAGTSVEGDGAVVLFRDSPGGTVAGMRRAAVAIRYPRRKRPGQWTDRTRAKRARRLEKARRRVYRCKYGFRRGAWTDLRPDCGPECRICANDRRFLWGSR